MALSGPGGHAAVLGPFSQGSFLPGRLPPSGLLSCPVEQVEVCVKGLSVSTYRPWSWQYICTAVCTRDLSERGGVSKAQPTILLRNISATIPQGSLTAIIGGSGSGKTTLLNAIAGRRSAWTAKYEGSIAFNGKTERDGIRMTYLPHEDILHPTLTVRETLQYAADLSLARTVDKEKRHALVELVMDDLGLKSCANNRVAQACSSGQRRRTSIGVQILANSSVVLCDEPTTGLDATSALQIVRSLKRLAQAGQTVVISIHAPRPEIWELFDQTMLLSQGSVIFAGPTPESVDYFRQLGYTAPQNVNPAEFLVDLAAVDTRTTVIEAHSIERIDRLAKAWQTRWVEQQLREVPAISPSQHIRTRDCHLPSFMQKVYVLTGRTFKATVRDRIGLAGTLIRVIGMAVLNGWIFYGLDGSLAGIRSRQGSLYVASNLNGYITLLHEVIRFSSEAQAFFRERNDGLVDVPSFLISRVAARVFLEDLLAPLLFSVIFYFMVGFRTDASQFFIFYVYCILTHYTAISFAVVCVGLTGRFASASLACNLSFALQSFTCGYFIQTRQIPVYVRWLKWCSYMFYIYSGLCTNEFRGQFYSCPVSNNPSNPACRQYVGDTILDDLGFPSNWGFRPIVVGIAFVLGFYILGGKLLCYELPRTRLWQVQRRDHAAAAPDVEPTNRTNMNPEKQHVLVGLQNYGLVRKHRDWLGRVSSSMRILGPITTEFRPGHLNVIMGPEGSGKTSLLNSLARKRPQSVRTQFTGQGFMLYNGTVPSTQVIRSAVSLVGQDRSGLISSLTVRETIQFAAELRLSAWLPKAKKLYRAEETIQTMSLKGCADNMIQSISGGEYRRVMIAIQLLTDPRVLLLDEPTSGLDVFTAQSLVELLKGLATRGQTIIMTIHQSRASSFCHFSHVLLLASGGQQVYSASGKDMIPYFTSLGYLCPEPTNAADFVLDLVSDDYNGNVLQKAWEQRPPSPNHQLGSITASAQLGSLARDTNSLRVIFLVAFRSSALSLWRNPAWLLTRSLQVIALGAIIMLFYAPLQHDYQSVQSRMGFVQEFAAFYFVGLIQNAVVYPGERDIFYSEEADGCHSTESFLLQYTLLEVPFEVGASLIFGLFAAFVCDLDRTVKMFLICAANCAFILNCGESIGIMLSTVVSHGSLAVNIVSVLLSISTVLGGIMSLHVNSFLSALNYLSPVKYLIANLASYSMQEQSFTCTEVQRLPNGQCPIADGAQVLALYNLDKNAGLNLMGLGICTVAYRLVAYALLRIRQSRIVDKVEELLALLRLNETST